MKNDKSLKILVIATLVVTVAGLSVAYATLSQTLNISGTVTAKGASWDIKFTSGSCTKTGSASVDSQPTVTATSISGLTASLTKPGDSVNCSYVVTNNGTLPAKLSSITGDGWIVGGSGGDQTMVTNNTTRNDLSGIANNDIINPAGTKTISFSIIYKNDATTVQATNIPITYTKTLNFVQS
ncbi:MAG: hypothetical protein RR847_00425 [Bacilli bacterium]